MTSNPQCPDCGEPVGMTATYCMHCDAEFDAPVSAEASADAPGHTDAADASGADSPTAGGAASPDLQSWEERVATWVGPNGWIDNSLTIVIGVVAGVGIGLLTTVLVALLTGSLWALAVGFLTLAGGTAYLANHRTVYGAIQQACYMIAPLLLAIPISFIIWIAEDPLSQLDTLFAFELVIGIVAVPLLLIGKVAQRLETKMTATGTETTDE